MVEIFVEKVTIPYRVDQDWQIRGILNDLHHGLNPIRVDAHEFVDVIRMHFPIDLNISRAIIRESLPGKMKLRSLLWARRRSFHR